MPARAKMTRTLFLLLLARFVTGLYQLMALRFDSGDIYPPYSTLRSDPLGTKILYEAFTSLPGYTGERHFHRFQSLDERDSTTLFVLGLAPEAMRWWPDELLNSVESWLRRGNRLVIAFKPVHDRKAAGRDNRADEEADQTAPAEEQPAAETEETAPDQDEAKIDILEDRWNLRFSYSPFSFADSETFPLADLNGSRAGFPVWLEQHSDLYFEAPGNDWRIIYQRDDLPVLMERDFGAGSLVVVADAFLVSNEAMHSDRHPALLGWLAGAHLQLVFSEYHHGISSQSGIMVLAHKYRLTFFFAALLTLAGLAIWKWSVPFAPVRRAVVGNGREELSNMDYLAGLVNLLRRSVRPHELLPVCVREWRKSHLSAEALNSDADEKIGAIARQPLPKAARDTQILIRYRKIIDILAERKRLWK